MKHYLTVEQKAFAVKKRNYVLRIIDEFTIETIKYHGKVIKKYPYQAKQKYRCSCIEGQKIYQTSEECKFCNQSFSTRISLAKQSLLDELEARDDLDMHLSRDFKSKHIKDMFYYVEIHPDCECGLLIHRVRPVFTIDENGVDAIDLQMVSSVEIVPGKYCKGYTYGKKKIKEVDTLTAFSLNAKSMHNNYVVFDGCIKWKEFLNKYPEMSRITGLEAFTKSMFSMSSSNIIVYLALYSKYPVLELLLKMGYTDLVNSVYTNVKLACSGDSALTRIAQLNKLLNPDTTKGSLSLRLPRFIGEFLKEQGATLYSYLLFCDICQLDNSLNKDSFAKLLTDDLNQNFLHLMMSGWVGDTVRSIMAYHYSLSEILKYHKKQMQLEGKNRYTTYMLQYFYDYLRMCDLMQIEPQRFPKDIQKVHDELAKQFKAFEDTFNDAAIENVAKSHEKVIDYVNKNSNHGFIVKIPHCSKDLIREGQSQHNCVGSYIQSVASKRSVVFFIRKQDEPDESFVTAEYKYGHLSQLFYANNVSVKNKHIIDLAKSFVNKSLKSNIS